MTSFNRPLFSIIAGLSLLVLQQAARAGTVTNVLICNSGSACQILAQSTTGPVSASGALFGGTATGNADATGGILHAYSSFSLTAPAPVNGQVNGAAQFLDQITIDAPGLDGTTGYLVPQFSVTGSVSGSTSPAAADASVFAGLNRSVPSGCVGGQWAAGACYFTGNAEIVFSPIAFTFGQALPFSIGLGAITYYGPGGALNAVSDYSHTAVLNGLGVFQDSSATIPVSNPTFTSADGLTYSSDGIVPEPTSLILCAAGLASLALIRQRRKRFDGGV